MKKSVFFISAFLSRVFPFFLCCLFCAGQMSAATWYVKPGGNDASAGNSWATAYQTLTKALQSAASGDQIWVAAGTYKPTTGTDRTISFNMKTGVAILGGFPATGNPVLADRDWNNNVTTLSGDIGTVGDNSDNSYHVVSNFNVGISAVLDGFTLTAGSSNSDGGGMYCISSSPRIENCRFVSNSAARFGAGLFCGQNSNAVLNNCFFYSNYAGSIGGGISSQESNLTISNTVFSGNSGTSGAGLCIQEAPAIVTNCVFSGNSASNLGGGMLTWNAASSVTNCSFSGNLSSSNTGGLVNYGTTSAILRNCIFWGNKGSGVTNVGGGTALVTHSIVQGGYAGAGNLNVDPMFVEQPPITHGLSGDLRLQACSPAINKGSDAAVPAGVTTDLDGNNRYFGTVDMGAYEYQSNASPLVAACKNLTVQLNATGNASVPASAADNGSTGCGSLTFYLSQTNFNCSNVGTNNLLFVVSDNNFHSASCAVTVTVQDNTAPTAVCKDATVQLDASGNASLLTAAINNGSADACGIASLALSKTTFNCSNIGTNAVTLTATDNNSKTATCSATVTVQDNMAPTAVCKDASVQLDATGNTTVPASAVDNGSADACGIASLALSKTAFNCTNVGTNTVTLTVTDNHGKTATCTATVTIQDNTLPTAICKNATVQLDATGNVTVPASVVDNGSTDACGIAALTLSKSNFNCSNVGSLLVSLEVRDNNGNKAYCSTTLTVQDNIVPTAVCQNATIQLDANGNASIAASAINNGSADACGIASMALSKTAFDCSNIGTNAVTLTVTDNNGKTATCSATVTVQDNIAPTAVCQNTTIQLDASGNASIAASAINNGSADACGIASLALSKTAFDCSNIGTNAVTLTVTDNNGKTATCSTTVTVQDNAAPTAVCQNTTIQLDASGNASIAASSINNGSADACGIASMALSKTAFDCSNIGANPVTLTVTDNSGKTATCSATVTVQDNIAPTAVCQNTTIQLDASGNASIASSSINNGSADACGIASLALSKTAFDCSNIGANSVTMTVTDNSGKTATCSATVTVQDNAAPTAVCQNATIQLDGSGNASIAASAINNGSADACGIASMALSKTAFDCSNIGANAVTLTVTDNNGKTATCSATVTVQYNAAPTAVCQNATIQLDANGNASIAASAINNGSADACGIASLALSKTAFDCSNIGANAVTLTVTDNNGKTATCSATVTVQDNAAPTAVCQNATIQLDASGNANLSTSAINNGSTDACGIASMALSKTRFDCSNTGANAVTLTVTDNSGKNATCLASVTVRDIVPPTLTCPANIIRNNDPNLCSAVVTYQTPTATDNCGNPIAELDSPSNTASGNAFPKGTTVVQWKASDGGNLTTTCSFSITVHDVEAPILSCPPNIIRNTDWGICTAVVDYVFPTYSDNCPGSALSHLNGGASGSTFPKGTTVVTWMATDASNNTRTCSFRIIVGDGQAPTFTLCPSNQVLNCGQGACSIIATYQIPTATDNCSSTTVVRTGGPISGSSFLVGTTSIAWRALDASGRSSTCSFSITVLDNQAPQISCPQNIVQDTTSGDCNVPVFYPVPLATDNCGVNTTLLIEGLSSGSVFPIGTTVVTWRATDVSGSSATCSFSVTVNCGLNRPDPTVTRSPENTTFGNTSLRLSPNPANEHVLLSIEGAPQPEPTARIAVFDAAGRLVSEQNWPDGQRSLSFDVSNWESGIYWIIWRSAEKSLVKRLAVTHK